MNLKRIFLTLSLIMVFGLAAIAQTTADEDAQESIPNSKKEISVGYAGLFSRQSFGNSIQLNPTQQGGVQIQAGYRFAKHQGIVLTYGMATNTQKYSDGTDARVKTWVHEATAAYVLKATPSGPFQPFVLGGGGMLFFNPKEVNDSSIDVSRQGRPTILYGVGADYHLSPRLAIRSQYRGLIYNAPDFGTSDLTTDKKGHIAEPSVSIVFKF